MVIFIIIRKVFFQALQAIMQSNQVSDHLIFFSRIPYDFNLYDFNRFASQFGEISIYCQFIPEHGSCYVCYYDSRSAKKAFTETLEKSYGFIPNYVWNNNFPTEKLSSTLLISYKDNRFIELNAIIEIFNQFGDIHKFEISDDKIQIKLIYFDTRSSSKACNSNLDDFSIILIKQCDHQIEKIFSKTLLNLKNETDNLRNLIESKQSDSSEKDVLIQKMTDNIHDLEKEVECLKNKLSVKNSDLINKEIRIYKNSEYEHKYSNLKRTMKSYTKKVHHDRDRKSQNSNMDHSNEKDSWPAPKDFRDDVGIMNELEHLSTENPHSRKFSLNLYEYAFSLYLYSAKCYRFILQTFPFPAVSSLYRHFGEEMNRHKDYICSKRYSRFLIDSYVELFNIPLGCPCVISGDATVASGNPMYKSSKNGCVYLYQLQSLFPEIPVLPIYLKLNASSKFGLENLNDMFYLKNILEDLRLICFSISTDGDNGIDQYHIQVFYDFDQLFNNENEVVAIPKSGHPILDLYHVLKTQRARFFRNNLALSSLSPIFYSEKIKNLVKRGKCFSDNSEAIRFEDDYALDFFSPLSFLEVISIGEILIFSYYLLPFIFWQCAIRCLNLTNTQRAILLTFSIRIFKQEYDCFKGSDPEAHYYEKNVENCHVLSCWTRTDLIKFMNTIIAAIYAIKKFSNRSIFLQRLSNWAIEKTFGNTREYMNNSIDQDLFRNILVHEVLRKEMNQCLELKNTGIKPNEKGGVITSPETVETFTFDKVQIENEIQYLRNAAYSAEYTISQNDIRNLAILMVKLSEDPHMKDMIPNQESSTTARQILMRYNIPFNK